MILIALQILLNLVIAFVWMFLHDAWNLLTFILGYLLGMGIIFGLRRFFPEHFYLRRLVATIYLILLFIWELTVSAYVVAKQVTRPKLDITPGIFKVETTLESDWEITLLSSLITLTPGSVVMEYDRENRLLFIHTMDIPDSEIMVKRMKVSFERAIAEVTR